MQTFSCNSPINLVEDGKRLLGVTSFGATNSVFSANNEENSIAFSTPSHWIPENNQQTIDKLKELDKRDLKS